MKKITLTALMGAILVCGCSNSTPIVNLVTQVTVSDVSLVPYATPQGQNIRSVSVIVHNAGPKPIAEVWCALHVYDQGNNETEDSNPNLCLLAAQDNTGLLLPGQSMTVKDAALVSSDAKAPIAVSAHLDIKEAYEHFDIDRHAVKD